MLANSLRIEEFQPVRQWKPSRGFEDSWQKLQSGWNQRESGKLRNISTTFSILSSTKNSMINLSLSLLQIVDPEDTIIKDLWEFRITRNKYFDFSGSREVKIFFAERQMAYRPWYFLFLKKRFRFKKIQMIHWNAYEDLTWEAWVQPILFSNFVEAHEFIINCCHCNYDWYDNLVGDFYQNRSSPNLSGL